MPRGVGYSMAQLSTPGEAVCLKKGGGLNTIQESVLERLTGAQVRVWMGMGMCLEAFGCVWMGMFGGGGINTIQESVLERLAGTQVWVWVWVWGRQ